MWKKLLMDQGDLIKKKKPHAHGRKGKSKIFFSIFRQHPVSNHLPGSKVSAHTVLALEDKHHK